MAGTPLRVTVQENCPRRTKQMCNSVEARRKRGNDTRDAVLQVTHENLKKKKLGWESVRIKVSTADYGD